MEEKKILEKISKLEAQIAKLESHKAKPLYKILGAVAAFVIVGSVLVFAAIVKPYNFTSGTPINAANVNSNFDALYNWSSNVDNTIKVSNGNVGIGTANPTGKLQVIGTKTNIQCMNYWDCGGSDMALSLVDDGGSEMVRIREAGPSWFNNGNVGIGTNNPTSTLTVYKPASGSTMAISTATGFYTMLRFCSGIDEMFQIEAGINSTDSGAGINTFLNVSTNGGSLYCKAVSGGVYLASGATAWAANSDIRLKKDIKPIDSILDKISKINGVYYHWKDKKSGDINRQQVGVIAQEVEKVMPELVNTDENGIKSVMYDRFVPYLIEGVKALSVENTSLKAQNADLEKRLAKLEVMMNQTAKK